MLAFYFLNSRFFKESVFGKVQLVSQAIYKKEIIQICKGKNELFGKEREFSFVQVLHREKNGTFWCYQKSLKFSNLTFENKLSELIEEAPSELLIHNSIGIFPQRGAQILSFKMDIFLPKEEKEVPNLSDLESKIGKFWLNFDRNFKEFFRDLKIRKKYTWFDSRDVKRFKLLSLNF